MADGEEDARISVYMYNVRPRKKSLTTTDNYDHQGLELGNLQNDYLNSLEFCLDWLYSVVIRCQNLDIIDDRVVSCRREVQSSPMR